MLRMYDYIIVEGIDGVGKTSLCNELCKEGYEYKHFAFDSTCLDIKTKYMFDVFGTEKKKIVFDRSFISEFCYGNACRGVSRLSLDECIELMNHYKEKNTLLIYVESSREIAIKRRVDDKELGIYWDKLLLKYREIVNEAIRHMDVYVIRGE